MILVTGAGGMLGTDIMAAFSDRSAVGLGHRELDIADRKEVREAFAKHSPKVVINCAAFTDVDACEDQRGVCMTQNGFAVQNLARECKKSDALLVHFSTDYVFPGEKEQGYREDDRPKPLNAYGRSKLLGETLIREENPRHYIIRTAWLYGRNGNSFVKSILEQAGGEIRVVDDQHGSPTNTMDLALELRMFLEKSHKPGVYHIVSKGHCTRYDLAKEIVKIKEKPCSIIPVATADLPRTAKRPRYSILLNTKYKSTMPDWKTALRRFLK